MAQPEPKSKNITRPVGVLPGLDGPAVIQRYVNGGFYSGARQSSAVQQVRHRAGVNGRLQKIKLFFGFPVDFVEDLSEIGVQSRSSLPCQLLLYFAYGRENHRLRGTGRYENHGDERDCSGFHHLRYPIRRAPRSLRLPTFSGHQERKKAPAARQQSRGRQPLSHSWELHP